MPETPGRLCIITADDFGLHPAVNEAVESAHRAGVLTTASLMVAAPAAQDAAQRARALPGLHVGLHLTLADGCSVLPQRQIPDLVDSHDRFHDNMVSAGWRFFASPRVRAQLAAEIRAQFAAFAQLGLSLDHLDAHKHFHLHPTVLSLALRIGRIVLDLVGDQHVPVDAADRPVCRASAADVQEELHRIGGVRRV